MLMQSMPYAGPGLCSNSPLKLAVSVVVMEQRILGVVKWFNPRKGYGFIARPGEPDIFVHYSQIVAEGFRLLEDGQKVEFTLVDGDKGPHAHGVRTVADG